MRIMIMGAYVMETENADIKSALQIQVGQDPDKAFGVPTVMVDAELPREQVIESLTNMANAMLDAQEKK